MNGFVTARRPTSALLQAQRMVRPTNPDGPALDLLEVAFEAQVRVAHSEHLGVDRAVGTVARRAAGVQRFMFEDKRSALGGMTLQATGVLPPHRRHTAGTRMTFVGIVTLSAGHLAFRHRVMVWQTELTTDIGVTGVTNRLRRPGRGGG